MKLQVPKGMWKQQPSLREKIFFVAALLGILILFSNYFWSAQGGKLRALQADLKGVEMQTKAIRELIKAAGVQLKARQQEQQKPPAEMDPLIKQILGRDVLDATDEIHSTVALLGGRKVAQRVNIGAIDVEDASKKKNYTVVPMRIQLSGRFTGVQSYLDEIERLPRALVVRSVDLKTAGAGERMIEATVDVDLYIARR